MKEPAETREETKHSGGFGIYALWAGVVLILYVLSMGPALLVVTRDRGSAAFKLFDWIYEPVQLAYWDTFLHRPIGMYMHLWCPEDFDKNGEPPRLDL